MPTTVVQGRPVSLTAQFTLDDGVTPVDVTDLTLMITPVAGGAAVVVPTSAGITHPATGTYGYSWTPATDLTAGDYLAVWSGTYGGQPATAQEVVTVLAAPVAGAYASVTDLDDHIGRTPVNAAQLLVRASRDVDRALLCAVYDTTDPVIVAAIKLATLEQVAANLDSGNLTGNGGSRPGGFTLGRLAVQAPSGDAGQPRPGELHAQAFAVLQAAGLTGHAPQGY